MAAWLFDRMRQSADHLAVAGMAGSNTYRDVLDRVAWWRLNLADRGIRGRIVSLEGEYGVES
ncbi:MAG: hypothetical protein ABI665_16390, partial [Vicinamibacterales bacterium]